MVFLSHVSVHFSFAFPFHSNRRASIGRLFPHQLSANGHSLVPIWTLFCVVLVSSLGEALAKSCGPPKGNRNLYDGQGPPTGSPVRYIFYQLTCWYSERGSKFIYRGRGYFSIWVPVDSFHGIIRYVSSSRYLPHTQTLLLCY